MKKTGMIAAGVALAAVSGLAAVSEKMYSSMDTDGDGKVSRSEYLQNRAAAFVRLDANGDGYLDNTEFKFQTAIARCDQDKDGKLNAAEFATLNEQSFVRMDKDSDGFLTLAELN